MRKTVILTKSELSIAAANYLLDKPQFRGKHIAEIAMIVDPTDISPERQVRAEMTLFDTVKAAREYAGGNTEAQDAVPTQPKGDPSSEQK